MQPQGACLHPRGARQQPRGARLRLPPFRWSRDLLSAGCDLKVQPSRGRKRYIVGVVVPDDFFVPRIGPAIGPIFRGRFRGRAFVKSGSKTEFPEIEPQAPISKKRLQWSDQFQQGRKLVRPLCQLARKSTRSLERTKPAL